MNTLLVALGLIFLLGIIFFLIDLLFDTAMFGWTKFLYRLLRFKK